MTEEYIKIKSSFTDRVLFLFTGVINKKHIIEEKTIVSKNASVMVSKDDDNHGEETHTLDIPFFEFDKDDVKSNL